MAGRRISFSRIASSAIGAAFLAGALSGCGASFFTKLEPGTAVSPSAGTTPGITANVANKAVNVSLNQPVTVSTRGGTLSEVTLEAEGTTTSIPGAVSKNGTTWTSSGDLNPTTVYQLSAQAASAGGNITSVSETFTTLTPPKRLLTVVNPGGGTVGVGMVISLSFNTPIPATLQNQLLSHVTIETSTPVVGAWRWITPEVAHWRPENYWTSGTQVTVVGNLDGVSAGNGYWGLGNWSDSFTIGAQHIDYVNLTPHVDHMQVTDNGTVVRTILVSGGAPPTYDTIAGTLYVTTQAQTVFMNSATTFGIPSYAPGGYAEDVYYDNEISTDGYYIHWAPWNGDVGIENTSHGCVNIENETDAIWFFDFTQVGDVVIIQPVAGQTIPAQYSDGEGDWNTPFAQYANDGEPATMTTSPLS